MAAGRGFLSPCSPKALGQQDESLIDNNVSMSHRDESPIQSSNNRKDRSIIIFDSTKYSPFRALSLRRRSDEGLTLETSAPSFYLAVV